VSNEEPIMSATVAAIRGVRARAVIAPILAPGEECLGVIEAAPLVLIDVATDQGITGRSYIFALCKTDAGAAGI
jgi:mandelate racemase